MLSQAARTLPRAEPDGLSGPAIGPGTRHRDVLDHIAFMAAGLRKTLSRLAEPGVEFSQRQVAAQGLYQLFLFDPNGIKIELNFDAEETVGLQPEVMASDLDPANA